MAGTRSDGEWIRIRDGLKGHPGIDVSQEAATRQFLDPVLCMARAGAAGGLLPAEHGPWNSV